MKNEKRLFITKRTTYVFNVRTITLLFTIINLFILHNNVCVQRTRYNKKIYSCIQYTILKQTIKLINTKNVIFYVHE